jgi:hypothetical protein
MSHVSYNLGNNKPLINREQSYVLDRKLITIHSEDRDISKWPLSNQFEVLLPDSIRNVQSLRIIEVSMPSNLYTFSKKYQNTKLTFSLNSLSSPTTIEIEEGFYSPTELSLELTNKMNSGTDTSFNVHYNKISQKLWFGHTDSSFNLDFSLNHYSQTNCDQFQSNIFNQYTNWGLPSYLGFDKKKYNSKDSSGNKTFDYIPLPNTWTDTNNNDIQFWIEAPNTINIMGDKCIYMDVEKYNTMDELYPYTQSINELNNYNFSGYSGKVNSAFAKIPINAEYDKQIVDSRTLFLNNLAHYEPPIERISKLKFTFRFHDGRLVDFHDCSFDFTLEFNCLKNEIGKVYNVRVPHTYLI